MHLQAAPFMHSASVDSATSQTSAQLQQQQTEQQRMRQQSHPQQQQYSNHIQAIQQDPELRRKVLVNRLLYRSRQRGFLEMDLLVGIWAEKQIPQLSENMLQQFEIVLDQENPDLYKWLTGQEQPPQDVAENAAYQALFKDVSLQLRDHTDQTARAPEGKEWMRGWDDWNKASETAVTPGPVVDK
ncbi:TPA: hypothetical protein ACH3X2_011254 [Trebouxia sp. C0005]